MKELVEYLQEAVDYTNFYLSSRNNNLLDHASPEEIRKLYEQGNGICFFYKVECRKDTLNTLTNYLNEKLRKYINEEYDNLVGYGLDHVTHASKIPYRAHNIKKIALLVIRAAILLTPVKAAEIFSSWLDKQPLKYKIVGLLNVISLEKPLFLDGGIEVNKVSEPLHRLSQNNVLAPIFGLSQNNNRRFKGVALSINVETSPAFYKVRSIDGFEHEQIKHTWQENGHSLYNFCEALSLSCNHLIYPVDIWKDGKDITAFISNIGAEINIGSGATSFPQLSTLNNSHIRDISTKTLSQELLNDAWEIYSRRSDTETKFLDVSIKRWLKSKQCISSIEDKLIELRIALETLYLSDSNGEFRFRLATRGARYLGKNLEERKEYYKILSDTYNVASKVVHGNEKKKIDSQLLENAQNLCRKGILKMLFQGQPNNWDEIVLG